MRPSETMMPIQSICLDPGFPSVHRSRLTTLQANLGYVCNQTCFHCHVNAGPNRREVMSLEVVDLILSFIRRSDIRTLDLTGGAPELNPHFRYLVEEAGNLGVQVLDRCNLTVLSYPGQEDLAEFLARHRVTVIASLPCYLEENVDAQRGDGVFEDSLEGIRRLNALGYGHPGTALELNLVYNPQGTQLPPSQESLQKAYTDHLFTRYGLVFNQLFTIANMPINRFAKTLIRNGEYETYLQTLRLSHEPANLEHVMCRSLISVDWKGYVFDCDFNQMLHIPLGAYGQERRHLMDLMALDLSAAPIAVGNHCFACTAGQGSSCGGALG